MSESDFLKPRVLIAHPGTQYSHQLVRQFERLGVLHRYWTGLCIPESGLAGRLSRVLPGKLRNLISNRILRRVPAARVRCSVLNELRAIMQLRSAKNREDILFSRNAVFQENVPESEIRACDIVVGFDTSSWRLAERARALGKRFILDYSTIHSNAKTEISADVLKRYPEWSFNIAEKSRAHLALEERELALANTVVVASSFTKRTLVNHGVPEDVIAVNPYGVDAEHFPIRRTSRSETQLKFVYVGAVNALKGIPMLVDCLSATGGPPYDLTIIGPVQESVRLEIGRQAPHIKMLGKIAHAELPSVLGQYDVLVFPSYFDGFGQVILEAMSMGMAVVTTHNTCGPDVIEDGVDGVLISAGDQAQLRAAIAKLSGCPDSAREIGQRAARKARKYSWDAYGERWNSILLQSQESQVL